MCSCSAWKTRSCLWETAVHLDAHHSLTGELLAHGLPCWLLAVLCHRGIRCHQVKPRTLVIHDRRHSSKYNSQGNIQNQLIIHILQGVHQLLQLQYRPLEVNGRIKMLGKVKPKPRVKVGILMGLTSKCGSPKEMWTRLASHFTEAHLPLPLRSGDYRHDPLHPAS